MSHLPALTVEIVTTAFTVAGLGYFLAALLAARLYLRSRRKAMRAAVDDAPAPGISILKSLKGLDPGMLEAFRSHCRQSYRGPFELLFGVSSLADPAAAAVQALQREFPEIPIRLIECPLNLGTNRKVSVLAQLADHARYPILLINDSDIAVGPHYLERVAAGFVANAASGRPSARPVGMVTALYRGRPHGTILRGGLSGGVYAQFEALGIATDFMAGVLLSRLVEGGLRYGLGSTLAVRREALEAIGGFLPLADRLADDHELGVLIAQAGYRIELCSEVVETSVPGYDGRGFLDHQLRWLRTVRDARPAGYLGLIFTHGLGWALLNVLASGASLLSLWLLALSFFLRLALAMTTGAEVLHDRNVLPHLWLVPLRDLVAMGLWVGGFASHTVVWRGETFLLRKGRLEAYPG